MHQVQPIEIPSVTTSTLTANLADKELALLERLIRVIDEWNGLDEDAWERVSEYLISRYGVSICKRAE